MFNSGDVVSRLTTPLEGGMKKGTICVVKHIIDGAYMTLEGHEGNYRQASFKLHQESHEVPKGQIRQVSDLEALVEALSVIDNWNRTHPTGMMIGVEPYPSQDGGMVVDVNGEGFNDLGEFHKYMSFYATKKDKQATLRHAMDLIQSELEE